MPENFGLQENAFMEETVQPSEIRPKTALLEHCTPERELKTTCQPLWDFFFQALLMMSPDTLQKKKKKKIGVYR